MISLPDEIDTDMEEFSTVESIMRCEDFKSNFARRLSNRFISRSPVSSHKQDTALKLRPFENFATETVPDNVPERIEIISQLSKNSNLEQNGDAVKSPDQTTSNQSDLRRTEVTVLNMEVETLRWQLAQTEANRQMHIALLKQIVTFLNKVKEHIELQNETRSKKDLVSGRLSVASFSTADLPRSRSVVHMNKNIDCTLNSPKKFSTRKISKSISNVNGFKDCNRLWSQSKLSLTPESETSQKISEEMSRLITLANTVLSTKLPDLSSSCNDNVTNIPTHKIANNSPNDTKKDSATSLTLIEEDIQSTNTRQINEKEMFDIQDSCVENFIAKSSNIDKLDKRLYNGKPIEADCIEVESEINSINKITIDRRNDFNSSHYMEDESGFSSMSSFQEIGIPIISIIPPSPCKELGYIEDIPDIIEETEKWKTDTIELDKQSVKVFWV